MALKISVASIPWVSGYFFRTHCTYLSEKVYCYKSLKSKKYIMKQGNVQTANVITSDHNQREIETPNLTLKGVLISHKAHI